MATAESYHWLASLLYEWGVPAMQVRLWATVTIVAGILLLSVLVYFIGNRLMHPAVRRLVKSTRATWDDTLLNDRVQSRFWLFVTVMILFLLLPPALKSYPVWRQWAQVVCHVLVIMVSASLISVVIKAMFDILAEHSASARADDDINDYNPRLLEERAQTQAHSLGGVCQMLQLVIVLVAAILIVSVLSGKNIVIILSGLGASAAVLMLVFRDSILGLVAGIQLTVNDMLRPGDWISIPRRDVNGRVRKINLTTVKVQNYDNTIVTIPPYILVSESFQNWRGMERSGGRRVMRSLSVDISTVRFLTAGELTAMRSEPWGAALPDKCVNVSAFRAYLEHYVATLPTMVPDMLYMIRELQPTPAGLPVEIYFFTTATEWKEYESVQCEVIDHALASVHRFGLRVYQAPSAADLSRAFLPD